MSLVGFPGRRRDLGGAGQHDPTDARLQLLAPGEEGGGKKLGHVHLHVVISTFTRFNER